MTEAFTFTTHD